MRCGTFFRNDGCLTEKTYERSNPKRVYYLSMEFLDRPLPGQ